MKKILLFKILLTEEPFPPRTLIFRKEVLEILPIGTVYLPFGNKLRAGIITGPYEFNEETKEFTMTAVCEIPYLKYGPEEDEYIRKKMESYYWQIFLDDVERLD